MSRNWEVSVEQGSEQAQQKDVPIFSNRDGKYSSGVYAIERVVFLTKSESWLIITRHFKVFVNSNDMPNTWKDIDQNIFKQLLMAIQVNRLQWRLVTATESCPYELSQTEKCEIYSPEVLPDDELEEQPGEKKPSRMTARLTQ